MSAAKLPTDAKARKNAPIARGVLDYFPRALAAVAEVSRIGNEQHNPGQPMHWEKGKSTDHADCLIRHMVDRGTIDCDGALHSAKVAWRALALLETELEEAAEARPFTAAEVADLIDGITPTKSPFLKRVAEQAAAQRSGQGWDTYRKAYDLEPKTLKQQLSPAEICNHEAYAVRCSGDERHCAGCGFLLGTLA